MIDCIRVGYLFSSDLQYRGSSSGYSSTSQAFWTCPSSHSCHVRSFQISYFTCYDVVLFLPRFLLLFLLAPHYYFLKSYLLPNRPFRQFYTTGGSGRYSDCIAVTVYSNSQGTMYYASEFLVTFFEAISQSIKKITKSRDN